MGVDGEGRPTLGHQRAGITEEECNNLSFFNDARFDALLDQAEKFDDVRPAQIRVHAAEISDAVARLDPAVRSALEEAIVETRSVRLDSTPSTRAERTQVRWLRPTCSISIRSGSTAK